MASGEATMLRKATFGLVASWAIICTSASVSSTFIVAVTTTGVASAQEVDGEPITEYEIEQRLKFDQLTTHREPSREDVIAELGDEKHKSRAAQQSGIAVTDSDVDTAYATMAKRMNLTPEQLMAALARAGIEAGTLKRIRVDLAWRQYTRSGIPILNDGPAPRKNRDNAPSWRE
jgi:parvulin-like peptidyl-prolyl isomerase